MKVLFVRYLAVGTGGFIGTLSRFIIGDLIGRLPDGFPLGILFINVSGSMFLGWFMAYIASRTVSDTLRLAVAVGFVGGYTTFSTYMYDSFKLAGDGREFLAILNLMGSVILGIVGVRAGMMLARRK